MANLTAQRSDKRQDGSLISTALAAVKVFKGAFLNFNTSGYAKPASDTASEVFAGVAVETVDNSAGAAGALSARVWKDGVVSADCSGATQAWVGQDVFIVDDHTVALAATTTNDVRAGRVVQFVSATEVRIKL